MNNSWDFEANLNFVLSFISRNIRLFHKKDFEIKEKNKT